MSDESGLGAHWDHLANDARWAVLSDPQKRGGGWSDDDFWATGVADVTRVLRECDAAGLTVRRERALDFGSGVGRLSRALASHFERVDGVDVSPSMVRQARTGAPANAHFHENQVTSLRLFADGTFDFALSLITLQHMPAALMRTYLLEFGRVLRPGGVAHFQIPTGPKRPLGRLRLRTLVRRALFRVPGAKRAWVKWRGPAPIEMFALPRAEVERLAKRAGLELRLVAADEAAGDDWHSLHYVALKR